MSSLGTILALHMSFLINMTLGVTGLKGTSVPFTRIKIPRSRKDWELRDLSIFLVDLWTIQHMLKFHPVCMFRMQRSTKHSGCKGNRCGYTNLQNFSLGIRMVRGPYITKIWRECDTDVQVLQRKTLYYLSCWEDGNSMRSTAWQVVLIWG